MKTLKFPLGIVVATQGVLNTVKQEDIMRCIQRHSIGDWGDLCEEDKKLNEEALIHGDRLFSSYILSDNLKVYVITEWDRSVTTILLPEEY